MQAAGSTRRLWGTIAVLAGLLLFGFNAGFLPAAYKALVFSWPSGLIVLGILVILQRAVIAGTVLLVIGGYLISGRLGYPIHEIKKIVLPALLVLVGFALILRSRCPAGRAQGSAMGKRLLHNGRIVEHNMFGGSRQQIRDEVFHGGEIHCLFGGSELDLTRTSLPEGTTILDVRCLFGGITLTVPTDWNVQLQTQSIFGGFVEENHPPRTAPANDRMLLIRGSCIIGGGEVRYRDPE